MSFASVTQPTSSAAIERLSASPQLTFVVGAGASMEALLPSWPNLLRRLLRQVAEEHPTLETEIERATWVDRTIGDEDLLAAGAIVEALAEGGLEPILTDALFGEGGPASFEPGPIAHQVARLRVELGDRLALLTTNYDDLLERALLANGIPKRSIKSYVRRRTPPHGAIPITHLHGYAGRDNTKNVVLTEEHYHRMQRGSSWQEQMVTDCLQTSTCLFVGTSLTDPNLIRYLYGYRQSEARRHAAIFIRQGQVDDLSDNVRAAREDAVSKRWGRCGVEAVFLDHYADAAQFVYEIGLRRKDPTGHRSVGQRAEDALNAISSRALLADAPLDMFAERQVELSRWLRITLTNTLATVLGDADLPGGERLALALWLIGPDGRCLTGWAHSDRAHQDPATIEAVPILPTSPWVSVRTVCQGGRVEMNRASDVSRWRYVRGLPLILEHPTRLPIGCLTISSTKADVETVLTQMPADAKADLHQGLLDAVVPQFERVVAEAL